MKDDNVKKVLQKFHPNHYTEEMWDAAFRLNNDELDLLKKYGQESQFIVQYVYDNPKER